MPDSSPHPPAGRRFLIDLNLPVVADDEEYSVASSDCPPPDFSGRGGNATGKVIAVGEDEEEEEEEEELEAYEEVEEEDPEEEEGEDPVEEEGDGRGGVGGVEEVGTAELANEGRRVKRKQSDYEVFVGGLDREAMEEDLEKAFKDVGDVVEVRLVRQPRSRLNKGFAFVRFATLEQASRAVKDLKVAEVRGKLCGVMRRNAKETLFVRNICTTWTKDVLTEELKAYKLDNLEEVHLMEDPHCKGRNRGYAFLDFSTHMDAVVAFNKLRKESVYLGVDVRSEVTFAKSNLPDAKIMAKVKSVFLDGLPATWDKSHVCEHFQKYGDIENVELACHMPNAKRQDFGFITFRTRDAALACIDGVNELGVVEGTEKVCVKATLRRPSRKQSQQIGGGWRAKSLGKYHDKLEPRQRRSGDFYFDRSRRSHESVGRDYGNRSHAQGSYAKRRVEFTTPSPSREKYGAYSRKDAIRGVPSIRYRDMHYEDSIYDRRELAYERAYHQPSYPETYRDELYIDGYYESGGPAACDYPSVSGLKRRYSALTEELASEPLTRQSARGYGSAVDAYNGLSSDDEYRSHGSGRGRHASHPYRDRYFSRRGASRSSYN